MAEAAPIPIPAAAAAADAGQPPVLMDSQAPASGEGEVAAAPPLLSASAGPSTSGTAATAAGAPPTAAPTRKEKRAAGAAAKTKPAVASLPSRAEENKYRTKYKQLKVKVQEIEDENAKIQAKILNTKRQIQRLRLERSILYERFVDSRGGPLEGTSMAVDSHAPPGASADPPLHPSTSGSALPHVHQHQQDDAFTAGPANGYNDYPASLPYAPPGSSRVVQEASEPSSRVAYQSPAHAGNGYHGIVNDVRSTPHHAMIVPASVDQQQLPSMVSASASPTHGFVAQMAGSPRQAVQMSPTQHSPMGGVQREGS